MRWLPSRQVALTVLLVLLVAVAGCSGGNGPATTEDGSDDETDDVTDTEADESTMTDGGSTTTAPEGGTTPGEEMTPGEGTTPGEMASGYEWTEGESYTYVASSQQGDSTYTWTVTDVSDGEVTVELAVESPQSDGQQTSTLTGPQGDIFGGETQNLQALTFVFLQLPSQLTEGRSLEVGNSWTISSDELETGTSGGQTATPQEITVEVTGTSQIAGTQCYNIEASSPQQDGAIQSCVKADWPFALTFSATGGQMSGGSIELTDYERP
ncbi:hypothetical protein [Halorientalis marina]|uniref:hypothetical protein n=1 Tax=Halorientalis marina TaxID=2931976 RepID=UPI001FF2EFEC|nr:hypothetical protein [Halorientalis marina]